MGSLNFKRFAWACNHRLEACKYNFLISQHFNYSLFFVCMERSATGSTRNSDDLVNTADQFIVASFIDRNSCVQWCVDAVASCSCFRVRFIMASSEMMSYSNGGRLRPSQTSIKSLIYLVCVKFLLINTIIVVILRSFTEHLYFIKVFTKVWQF